MIFRENAPATHLYVIAEGKAKVFKTAATSGREYILGIMTSNDILGAVAMSAGEKYPASCIALSKCTVLSIAHVKLINLIQHTPQIALNMLAWQAQQLRKFALKIEQLSLKNTQQKLADFLLKNVTVQPSAAGQAPEQASRKASGQTSERTMEVNNSMNMQDLANYLGVTRENLSRTFSNFIQNNIITKRGAKILIKHVDVLKKIAV